MPRRKVIKKKTNTISKAEKKSMGKYIHRRTEVDGIMFDSQMESEFYTYLKEELAAGRIKSFKMQPEFLLQEKFIKVNGEIITGSNKDFDKIKRKSKEKTVQAIVYRSDFDVIYDDDTRKIIDVKGEETADFKLKKKMFMFLYPELTLQLVIWDKTTKQWMDYDEHKKLVSARKKLKKAQKAKKEAM